MKLIKYLSVIALLVVMTACGASDAKKVEQKIKDGQQLSEADYTEMINYCGKFAKEAQTIQNEINALPASDARQGTLEEKLADLAETFPYLDSFNSKISNATKEQVGEKNVELINKYAPLIWFTAPDWATVGSLENVEGFIENMPSSDSTGVISSGAGVAVEN